MIIAAKNWFLTESGELTNDEELATVQLVLAGSPIPGYLLKEYPELAEGAAPEEAKPIAVVMGTVADNPVTVEAEAPEEELDATDDKPKGKKGK